MNRCVTKRKIDGVGELDAQQLKAAAAVGYEDGTHFRGLFKRHAGMTPTEYRNRFGPLVRGHHPH